MSPVVEQILQQIVRVAFAVRNRLSPTEQAQILQHLTHPTETPCQQFSWKSTELTSRTRCPNLGE
jgi:hypothetical protein